jgi:hypothetical protein
MTIDYKRSTSPPRRAQDPDQRAAALQKATKLKKQLEKAAQEDARPPRNKEIGTYIRL